MSSEQHATVAWTEESPGMETPLFADAETALHTTRAVVGRKWHPVILFHLLRDGPLGFSALKDRADGISSKMLSESLTDLEDEGLVTRELLDEKPVRVEYAVSEKGASIEPVIEAMVDWGTTEDE